MVNGELQNYLSNIEKDDAYKVVEVLKDSAHSRTELVVNGDGRMYIRKYLSLDVSIGENEYTFLSRLNHPALPKVYDYYELSGKGVLIEEYIEGSKLSELIGISGSISEPKAVEITKEICKVCLYLHQQWPAPIIHRDIKPDNIICGLDGSVKLIDFGAAREYKSGGDRDTVYVGTIGFAPPEQFGFGQTDTRADIYGIGMTLLNMLTGKSPERGQKISLPKSGISPDIQRIIDNAIQFDPTKRYNSVADLLAELEDLVPQKKGISGIKERVLDKSNDMFPKHLKWPVFMKWLIMPIHGLLALMLAVILWRDIFEPTGFGLRDDFIRFFTDMLVFVFIFFPPYILGFNLFNINEKVSFFHQWRFFKKLLIILASFFIAALLLSTFSNLHSEGYKLAQNLAAS